MPTKRLCAAALTLACATLAFAESRGPCPGVYGTPALTGCDETVEYGKIYTCQEGYGTWYCSSSGWSSQKTFPRTTPPAYELGIPPDVSGYSISSLISGSIFDGCIPALSLNTWVCGVFPVYSEFGTIVAPSGTNPVADVQEDILNLSAGSAMSITGDETTDTITFAVTDATGAALGAVRLSGDLGGTAASPTVASISLTGDVTSTGLATTIAANAVALSTDTTGDYVEGITANQGLLKTGTEAAGLGLIDCSANQILKRNAGDTAWECAADATGAGSEAFPVGSVYIGVVSTNPGTLLGYGTWSAIGAGRVLVGLDSGDTDFDTVEETGGAKTVASSAQTFAGTALGTHQHAAEAAHTHTYTQTVNHTHTVNVGSANDTSTVSGAGNIFAGTTASVVATSANPSGGVATGTTAAGSSHQHAAITAGTPSGTNTPGAATSVVQPYFVVYMWKRVS